MLNSVGASTQPCLTQFDTGNGVLSVVIDPYKYVIMKLPHRSHEPGCTASKKISNDQELIQSDPISCPQNQKGNN